MWRLKTEQELLAEGWKWTVDSHGRFLDNPNGALKGFLKEGFVADISMEALWNHLGTIGGYSITNVCEIHRDMMIKGTIEPLVPLCSCAWNKHPLFCKCN